MAAIMDIQKRFNDLKIKTKLLIVMTVIIAYMLIFGALSYYYINRIQFFVNIALLVENLSNKIYDLQDAEKDFLLKDQKNSEYFETGKSSNLDDFLKYFTEAKSVIREFDENIDDDAITANIAIINEDFDIYKETFYKLTDTIKLRGYQEFGLIGELRQTASDIINDTKQAPEGKFLTADLIEFQLIQTLYLLNRNPKYRKEANFALNEIKNELLVKKNIKVSSDTIAKDSEANRDSLIINDSLAVLHDEKSELYNRISKNINRYDTLFQQLVTVDMSIGLFHTEGLIGETFLIIERIDGNLDTLTEILTRYGGKQLVKSLYILIILVILVIGSNLYIIHKIRTNIHKPLQEFKNCIDSLGKGDLHDKIEVTSKDEIGEMAQALNELTQNLDNTKQFAIEVGKGNLETEINVFNNQGELGSALAQMREELLEVAKEREVQVKEEEQRNWATKGVAQFSDILRQSSNDMEELGREIMENLVKYTGTDVGGLFVVNEDNKDDVFIELAAVYAYDRHRFLHQRFNFGEGVVGTCAVEKKTVYMTKIPEEYVEITSGLGKSNPRMLLLVPLHVEDKLFGILEIASLKKLEPYEIEFVEKVGENIAATLFSVQTNVQTERLLEQSQKQAEELASQEEEMRQNLEELQATQESAARKSAEASSQFDAINKTNAIAEFGMEGEVLKANSIFCEISGYTQSELIRLKHAEMVSDAEKDDYIAFWQTLLSGKTHSGEYVLIDKDKTEFHIKASYIPLVDENNSPYKIILIANDITQSKKQENILKAKNKELEDIHETINVKQIELEKANDKMKANEGILKKQFISSKEKEKQLSELIKQKDEEIAQFKELLKNNS